MSETELEADGWRRWDSNPPPCGLDGFDVECTIEGVRGVYITTVDEDPTSWNAPGLFWRAIIH